MRRVLFLAGFLAIIPTGLPAQGRAVVPARSGAVAPVAGASTLHPSSGLRTSMVPVRSLVHGPTSPGNHLAVNHSPSGHVILRRSTSANGAQGSMHGTVDIAARGGQLRTGRRGDDAELSSDFSSVPGLGFDYAHVAATHPNAVNARHHSNDGTVLFPFFDGGYFVPTGPGAIADAQGEAQPAEDAEEENSVPADRPARSRSVDRIPVAPVLALPAPQRDVPEYVFVRRDGTVFFAVAYSWEKGSLRYVSSEGLRRSVARDTLDLDATQQFNEQRGMTFRSPA
jgi:hypothetical protein